MLKSLFCKDISVEYKFKSEKFKGVSIDLNLNNLVLSGNSYNGIQKIADAPTLTYIVLYIRDGICQNLSF